MNCSNCKGPIKNNTDVCEWCGSDIINLNTDNKKLETTKKIKFVFEGEWFLLDAYVEVYFNGRLLLKSSVKRGFEFIINNEKQLPVIKLETPYRSKSLKLPTLSLNENYLIELEFSRLWGNFCSKPKRVIKLLTS